MKNPYSIKALPSDVMHEATIWVKNRRKQLQWSQAELAERSGVSYGSIKRFETSGKIAFEAFLKILHVLDYLDILHETFTANTSIKEVEKLFNDQNHIK